ncbi:MAG: hypothetical protein WD077_14625 [Bacteroidia bacterium]
MIKLFHEKRIDDALNLVLRNVQSRINSLSDYEILNRDLNQMAGEISQNHQINELEIDLNDRKVETTMENIPGSLFPPGTDVRENQYYSCAKVNYTFTIQSGDPELLSVHPRTGSLNYDVRAEVNGHQFTIGYQTRYSNSHLSDQVKQDVKDEIRPIIQSARQVIDAINNEVKDFNKNLKGQIQSSLEDKRQELQKRNDQNDDLNKL